jgi:positive regulator of sigma E activity
VLTEIGENTVRHPHRSCCAGCSSAAWCRWRSP